MHMHMHMPYGIWGPPSPPPRPPPLSPGAPLCSATHLVDSVSLEFALPSDSPENALALAVENSHVTNAEAHSQSFGLLHPPLPGAVGVLTASVQDIVYASKPVVSQLPRAVAIRAVVLELPSHTSTALQFVCECSFLTRTGQRESSPKDLPSHSNLRTTATAKAHLVSSMDSHTPTNSTLEGAM